MKTWRTDLENMVFIIRNEGIKPLEIIFNKCDNHKLVIAQHKFMNGLNDIMKSTFNNANIIVINMEKQLTQTYKDLAGKKTISLDTYFKGTYNLEVTRLFEIVNNESKFRGLTSRLRDCSIEQQIEKIEPGEYIIVDDDAVGGRTIKTVTELLGPKIKIVDKYLMMDSFRNKLKQPILDVVDCRDFIAGSTGGLTTQVRDLGILRLPYMYPFVDIDDKANIPEGQEIEFSQQIWKLNKQFWIDVKSDLRLKDVCSDFIAISEYLGMDKETPMADICDRYEKLAKKGLILSRNG